MRRILSVAAVALVAMSSVASAQRGTVGRNPSPEIGVDAGIAIGLGDIEGTDIQIPARHVRMGFFMSPALSIEPTFGLSSFSVGGNTSTNYQLGVGALYHFSTSRAANQFYVRPFLNLYGQSNPAPIGSSTDVAFGVGGGIKMPLMDRLATRFEANIETSDGNSQLGLLAGLSFYTR